MNKIAKQGSIYGEDSEADVDGTIAEAELHRLQRQLRQLESERKTFAEETRGTLNRQTGAMEKLGRDNEFLKEELKLLQMQLDEEARSGSSSKKSESFKQQIDFLQKSIKDTVAEIQILDKKASQMDKSLSRKRISLGNSAGPTGSSVSRKQVTSMENRLDKGLVRFNNSLEYNGKLREQIDALRRERLTFDATSKKYEKELLDLKKKMSDIIKVSTAAYEAREDSQSKMISLKERAEKEHLNYIQELKELERQIEQDKKLREFMTIKMSERLENPSLLKSTPSQSGAKGSVDELNKKLYEFEIEIESIQEQTDCTTIEDLVQRFAKMEEENFSLFNYVNEINSQVDSLSEDVFNSEQIKKRSIGQDSDTVKALDGKLRQLDEEIKRVVVQKDELKARNDDLSNNLNTVVKDIDHVYEMLQLPPVKEKKNIALLEREQNVLHELRSIEGRTNEMLMKNLLISLPRNFTSLAASSNDKDAEEADNVEIPRDPAAVLQNLKTLRGSTEALLLNTLLGNGPAAPPTFSHEQKSPLSDDDFTGVDDLDDKPATREELKEKTRLLLEAKKLAASSNSDK